MKLELNELQQWIYDLIYNNNSIYKFEDWIYYNDNIMTYVSYEDYIDLISINYEDKYARENLLRIIDQYVDYGVFESINLIRLLGKCLDKNLNFGQLAHIYQEFYYMYCKGYTFLDELAITYGVTCVVPPSKFNSDYWDELNDTEKEEIIDSFYPEVKVYIENTIELIVEEKIVLTGCKNELDRWIFDDNR
ncbi:hypothetical protein SH1V18_38090 [Vallitalea longa]|uniref:Uncharacterized protein n=1 Tax=Vallitalea longa TaxID=2936439 RepID=A0A9W5YG68_9FIRM|nr:hypothetical protein [Vallitalea longa]GKX31329.1 hypothetical protein SH1V18_38090 [Vallitalea longa]